MLFCLESPVSSAEGGQHRPPEQRPRPRAGRTSLASHRRATLREGTAPRFACARAGAAGAARERSCAGGVGGFVARTSVQLGVLV